ncbi:hypothetical protein B2D07_18560 [Desulfococcus multivorans]|uniref:Uncharacterized protein n=2 Tax=Desulfococcus multivorans TaxID=897 RepID=S7T617_DESML|nr:uncharacterized protein Dmul_37150 [Desulfococcus multivorans]AQV02577.1 hypothetical protein B2D07_18560 [Desulfococcus multivorans]EPR32502.1 hypothetical protein dsmv_0875 [Desulfococcus multivorans DSM 2059]SKA27734.1 hypothetical protein SAMN02745446_03724 [Desulfococcus multivorans DSM 2059]
MNEDTVNTKVAEIVKINQWFRAGIQVRPEVLGVVKYSPRHRRDSGWMGKRMISVADTIDQCNPMWLVQMMYELGWWGYWIGRAFGF